jgi:histidine ammonia-lyase
MAQSKSISGKLRIVVHDTIQFVRGIITTEMNSVTDNPVSY